LFPTTETSYVNVLSSILSVVPGHFDLYDDLKTAERATYTFIEEMESGGKVSGKEALVNNPGGGTVHSSQKAESSTSSSAATTTIPSETAAKVEQPAAKPEEIPAKISADETSAKSDTKVESQTNGPTTPAPQSTETSFSVGEKIQAKYSQDGRWYNAVINNIKEDKFLVYYIDYGNTEYVTVASVRKHIPAPAKTSNNNNRGNNYNNKQGQNRAAKK